MQLFKSYNQDYKNHLSLLSETFGFIRNNFATLLALGCTAAFGRVLQLGGFGAISPLFNSFLEVVIQSSRVFLFIYVLGEANVFKGGEQIVKFFMERKIRTSKLLMVLRTIKLQWLVVLVSMMGYGLLVLTMNYLIDASAYQTCFLLQLKTNHILESTASEWSMLLFLKNVSVIPFTIIFETLLILWLSKTGNNFRQRPA